MEVFCGGVGPADVGLCDEVAFALAGEEGDGFEVHAEFVGEVEADGGGEDVVGMVAVAGGVFVDVELVHESEADGFGELDAEGEDDAAFDGVVVLDCVAGGGPFDEGHDGECGFAAVVAPEVDFEAGLEVAPSVAAGVEGVEAVDDELEVDVVAEADFEVGVGEGEVVSPVVAGPVDEVHFELDVAGVHGVGAFGLVGAIGAHVAHGGCGGGVEEMVVGFVRACKCGGCDGEGGGYCE